MADDKLETVEQVSNAFNGAQWSMYVHFNADATVVTLDSAFTKAELLRIASVMGDAE